MQCCVTPASGGRRGGGSGFGGVFHAIVAYCHVVDEVSSLVRFFDFVFLINEITLYGFRSGFPYKLDQNFLLKRD